LNKLHAETSRCNHSIGQVKKETEAELVAVNKKIQAVSEEQENKLEQNSVLTDSILN
jgi:hypothetical protein